MVTVPQMTHENWLAERTSIFPVQLEDDTAAPAAPAYTQEWFWRLILPAAFTALCLVSGILYAAAAPQRVHSCGHAPMCMAEQ